MRHTPFTLSVSTLMHKPGTSETIRLTVPAPTHYGEAVCVVAKGEPLEVDLLAESVHEGILVSGTVTTRATAECVRCLDPIEVAIEAPLQELFAYLADEAYDYLVVQESIDLDQVVRDQVVVELPFQPVCQDDCPGLDPATGIKRETGSAQANTTRTDPRWAKLHDVFPGTSTEGDPGSPPQS